MLSIVIPCSYTDVNNLSILGIESVTDVDHEIVVSVQGGIEEDLGPLKGLMVDIESPWTIAHEREIVGIAQTTDNGIQHANRRYMAVISPSIAIMDDKWFGKMQDVFLKVPHPGMVSIPSKCMHKANLPPVRLSKPYDHPADGLVLTTKTSLQINRPIKIEKDDSWAKLLSERCARNGSSRWVHNGVVFDVI